MSKETELLEARLDFVTGQVHALKCFAASFMAVSLERDAFVAAIPAVEDMIETYMLPSTASEMFLKGAREVCETMHTAARRSQGE
ncbi:MAG: hypothetical protein AB7E55_31535 [Pigmentiphaga sp.]